MNIVKGVYILIISVDKNMRMNVGALGSVNFEKGFYAYVGSAQNGIEKRVKRHFRKAKRKFWHIDYLLKNKHARVVEVFYKEAGKAEECTIATKISKTGIPVKGFGSSDCECRSHLVKIKDYESLRAAIHEIRLQQWL